MILNPSEKAFSLVELLVSISIIAVISAIGLVTFSTVQRSGRDAQRESDLRLIQSALQQYYADINKLPNDLSSELANSGSITNCSGRVTPCTISRTYMGKVPKDPKGTAYMYRPYTDSEGNNCALSGNVETGVCHRYMLCALMESPPSGSSCTISGTPVGGYNYKVSNL